MIKQRKIISAFTELSQIYAYHGKLYLLYCFFYFSPGSVKIEADLEYNGTPSSKGPSRSLVHEIIRDYFLNSQSTFSTKYGPDSNSIRVLLSGGTIGISITTQFTTRGVSTHKTVVTTDKVTFMEYWTTLKAIFSSIQSTTPYYTELTSSGSTPTLYTSSKPPEASTPVSTPKVKTMLFPRTTVLPTTTKKTKTTVGSTSEPGISTHSTDSATTTIDYSAKGASMTEAETTMIKTGKAFLPTTRKTEAKSTDTTILPTTTVKYTSTPTVTKGVTTEEPHMSTLRTVPPVTTKRTGVTAEPTRARAKSTQTTILPTTSVKDTTTSTSTKGETTQEPYMSRVSTVPPTTTKKLETTAEPTTSQAKSTRTTILPTTSAKYTTMQTKTKGVTTQEPHMSSGSTVPPTTTKKLETTAEPTTSREKSTRTTILPTTSAKYTTMPTKTKGVTIQEQHMSSGSTVPPTTTKKLETTAEPTTSQENSTRTTILPTTTVIYKTTPTTIKAVTTQEAHKYPVITDAPTTTQRAKFTAEATTAQTKPTWTTVLPTVTMKHPTTATVGKAETIMVTTQNPHLSTVETVLSTTREIETETKMMPEPPISKETAVLPNTTGNIQTTTATTERATTERTQIPTGKTTMTAKSEITMKMTLLPRTSTKTPYLTTMKRKATSKNTLEPHTTSKTKVVPDATTKVIDMTTEMNKTTAETTTELPTITTTTISPSTVDNFVNSSTISLSTKSPTSLSTGMITERQTRVGYSDTSGSSGSSTSNETISKTLSTASAPNTTETTRTSAKHAVVSFFPNVSTQAPKGTKLPDILITNTSSRQTENQTEILNATMTKHNLDKSSERKDNLSSTDYMYDKTTKQMKAADSTLPYNETSTEAVKVIESEAFKNTTGILESTQINKSHNFTTENVVHNTVTESATRDTSKTSPPVTSAVTSPKISGLFTLTTREVPETSKTGERTAQNVTLVQKSSVNNSLSTYATSESPSKSPGQTSENITFFTTTNKIIPTTTKVRNTTSVNKLTAKKHLSMATEKITVTSKEKSRANKSAESETSNRITSVSHMSHSNAVTTGSHMPAPSIRVDTAKVIEVNIETTGKSSTQIVPTSPKAEERTTYKFLQTISRETIMSTVLSTFKIFPTRIKPYVTEVDKSTSSPSTMLQTSKAKLDDITARTNTESTTMGTTSHDPALVTSGAVLSPTKPKTINGSTSRKQTISTDKPLNINSQSKKNTVITYTSKAIIFPSVSQPKKTTIRKSKLDVLPVKTSTVSPSTDVDSLTSSPSTGETGMTFSVSVPVTSSISPKTSTELSRSSVSASKSIIYYTNLSTAREASKSQQTTSGVSLESLTTSHIETPTSVTYSPKVPDASSSKSVSEKIFTSTPSIKSTASKTSNESVSVKSSASVPPVFTHNISSTAQKLLNLSHSSVTPLTNVKTTTGFRTSTISGMDSAAKNKSMTTVSPEDDVNANKQNLTEPSKKLNVTETGNKQNLADETKKQNISETSLKENVTERTMRENVTVNATTESGNTFVTTEEKVNEISKNKTIKSEIKHLTTRKTDDTVSSDDETPDVHTTERNQEASTISKQNGRSILMEQKTTREPQNKDSFTLNPTLSEHNVTKDIVNKEGIKKALEPVTVNDKVHKESFTTVTVTSTMTNRSDTDKILTTVSTEVEEEKPNLP